ncbi:GNAT family N-acetyltransferase [Bacillus luteolus]|uniref:GNAT family N-acetyltransferase n=1 Tax=Litchfieldia luteola TaxID=682179 RepID=A0ABR9QN21_9BACI|nr:GNAT family N-acetyltransferase [Cytobacillus luteolus]MBE4909910.1 GNAT family N-acetyltransferase [Cytobacillus luteolus]MBP1942535.1 diamine N-acetyltransferase [Cytobacillus luteolus]
MIQLKEITKENWFEIIQLQSAEDQRNKIFERDIASNCFSLAQASIEGTWNVKAIYDEDLPIGFTMYGYSEELFSYEICRIMIDYRHQGKGFGKTAIQLVIDNMIKQFDCDEILLAFHPGNEKAKKLYESVGFKDTGKVITQFVDELIYSYKVNENTLK